jgi:hypothetical protein
VLTRAVALLSLLLATGPLACARDVRVGVLGIFHPRQMALDAAAGDVIIVKADGETFVLEPGRGKGGAQLRVSTGGIVIEVGGRSVETSEVRRLAGGGMPSRSSLRFPEKSTAPTAAHWW